MSGPVSDEDAPPVDDGSHPGGPTVTVTASHEARVGAVTVRRALPRRARRMVGAWCFVDHLGPVNVAEDGGIDVGPHPHTGLQTVTWLVAGEVLHRDSLGTEQLIRAGQLNLMTAGHGVAHAEERSGRYRGVLHGVQLWVAQPEATRHGPAVFDHHDALPVLEWSGATATVLVGTVDGTRSHVRADTDHVGIDLDLRAPGVAVPVRSDHEHALVVLSGTVVVEDRAVVPGHLAYLGVGRDEVRLAAPGPARALLLGGTPFPEPILMWWNFVARTRDEITEALAAWDRTSDRFGEVASHLPRLGTAPPPWART